MGHALLDSFHNNKKKIQIGGKKFKEQRVSILAVLPSSVGAVNSTDWVFFILHYVVCLYVWSLSVSVCVCLCAVCVYMCPSSSSIPHDFTFSNITPAGPSLKVVNEHRNTVGSHQVVGVPGERLVLPVFRVSCRQTDGREMVSYNGCFFFKCKIQAVMHLIKTNHLQTHPHTS